MSILGMGSRLMKNGFEPIGGLISRAYEHIGTGFVLIGNGFEQIRGLIGRRMSILGLGGAHWELVRENRGAYMRVLINGI